MLRFIIAMMMLASPSRAGVNEVIDLHIMPGYEAFAQATQALEKAAEANCQPETLKEAYHTAFDAWVGVAHIRLGPAETASLSISFWPDKRGAIPRKLSELIVVEDPIAMGDYATVSAAARGFFALEAMLYNEQFSGYDDTDYSCDLVRAITADLAAQADGLHAIWQESYAQTLRTAGAAENAVYLSKPEAIRALYTQLMTGLEHIADQQLGRPMGSFERPRPARAEAWRSGRSARNIELSLRALQMLASHLADHPIPETEAAFHRAIHEAERPGHPGFQDVQDPAARFRLESLQNRVREIRSAIDTEIGKPLGMTAGFNSLDGD